MFAESRFNDFEAMRKNPRSEGFGRFRTITDPAFRLLATVRGFDSHRPLHKSRCFIMFG